MTKVLAVNSFSIDSLRDISDVLESDPFARQKLLEGWDQELLRKARVMVAGAGALGNEVLKNLALLGIGNIFIIDFDKISVSNLSRTVLFRESDNGLSKAETAAQRTKALCLEPTASVCYFSGDLVHGLGTGMYRRMDVVFGCLDNLEARMALSRNCWLAGTPWVDGGIFGHNGRVAIFVPGQTACFYCTLSKKDYEDIEQRYSCDKRRHRLLSVNRVPTIQTSSAIVAALQVQEALRLLHRDTSMAGKAISYHGEWNVFHVTQMTQIESHPEHAVRYEDDEVVSMEDGSASMRVRDFLETVSTHFPTRDPVFELETDFVIAASCEYCGHEVPVMKPLASLYGDEFNHCPKCGFVQGQDSWDGTGLGIKFRTLAEISIRESSDILELTLAELGVAPLQIVAVRDQSQYGYFELSKDAERLLPSWPRYGCRR